MPPKRILKPPRTPNRSYYRYGLDDGETVSDEYVSQCEARAAFGSGLGLERFRV